MNATRTKEAFILGVLILLGLSALGYLLGNSLIQFKEFERTVMVKGLAEKEVPADIALWPIPYSDANNDLPTLYQSLEKDAQTITAFLKDNGFEDSEITLSPPSITDKLAQQHGQSARVKLRYTGHQTVTIYSTKVEQVRQTMNKLSQLGKGGIVFSAGSYGNRTEFLFTKLNDIKPDMVEEATRKAREVAEKFAGDSNSRLGKIKKARQGQFSITNRDKNTPHIKKVRVVSTIEYYLSD